MRKPYDPIADEEPHIVAEYHFPNCTAYIADNYLRRLTPEQMRSYRHMYSLLFRLRLYRKRSNPFPAGCPPRGVADPRAGRSRRASARGQQLNAP